MAQTLFTFQASILVYVLHVFIISDKIWRRMFVAGLIVCYQVHVDFNRLVHLVSRITTTQWYWRETCTVDCGNFDRNITE
jgi:hypothetical protein